MNRSARVTITDIAKSIGMSHATVSMALKGDKRITEATQAKVRAAAAALGYKPSRLAQGLKSGQSMLIGVVSDRSSWMLGERWEGDWLSGLHDAARGAGYRLLLNLPIGGQDRTLLKSPISAKGIDEMTDGMVDGVVIIGGLSLSAQELKILEASKLPVVFAANDVPVKGHSQYLSGHGDRFHRIALDLIARGHRRIGVAGIAGADLFNKIARAELASAFKSKGLRFQPDWYKELSSDQNPGMLSAWEKAYRSWTAEQGVDALLLSYGDQANILEEVCDRHGLSPDQLPPLASFGPFNAPRRRLWEKGLLWDADAVQAGRETFGLLMARLQGGPAETRVLHWSQRPLKAYWEQGKKR